MGEQGYVDGELVEIPRVMLGKHFIHDVKILVPLTDIAITEVLGENILEYLNIASKSMVEARVSYGYSQWVRFCLR